MQPIAAIILFISLGYAIPEISKVRNDYREASGSEEVTKKLFDELSSVTKNDKAVLIAYKGAVMTMMAQYAEGVKAKKTFFKDGRELLEYAVATEPENVEVRCIRLSVKENAPKITGYKKNLDEDKDYILKNYEGMTDQGAKTFIKGFVSQSAVFTDAEKQLF